ncbi:gas vesicle protein GvpG [Actinomycetospora endophytica]|uniref:Gas vesicle protein GvpG n=1 Tax=Actinomycetospora endophytica TaxID=2291215 RepID=A0ABS8PIN9_9PSEU|nr:gas vesicle protein GvpG [Actinomycetospora endophytica]MCD2198119.1 gas vesicle protein GvpG [Actinomycetospora endophytica]
MGFFTELLLLPLAPVRGVSWVAAQIQDQVDYRLNDPGVIRAQIDELDAAFDREEITEAERDEQQEVLLRRLVGGPAADADPEPEGPA